MARNTNPNAVNMMVLRQPTHFSESNKKLPSIDNNEVINRKNNINKQATMGLTSQNILGSQVLMVSNVNQKDPRIHKVLSNIPQ